MSDEFQMNSTDEEAFDFSGDGIKGGDLVLTITDFAVEKKDNGTQHVMTFEGEGLPFPVKVNYWTEHTNPKAAQVGRGNLKKIATAALGQPKYTPATIKGTKVLAKVGEDDNGYARISNFRPAPAAVAVPSI